ncbi:Glutaredoxin-like domain [Evansella caseinilytica]|uniref:Glutaredoxin-like domain n=1 Tax=Evansella caseinilytica TaxID=1503961 RepID=A0A1H3SB44_9BACI|nr:glutaredoxin family protein [Evansella caseinilytica]SDZ34868.1 Glutaredoxin-like domain [Evansella caseinilytica]
MKTVYFYTKQGCPLCDKGLAILKELQNGRAFAIEERDIYANDEWLLAYQIRIPVVEDDAGNVLDEGILSISVLREKLNKMFT